ncbi:hypothetical protein ACIQRE_27850 [Streptomyces griseoluteus]|uniref:hypothetical protein n=1 Tax=Streptomyces griseoluteus TaxID=29306 RepID=UPI003829567E
MRLGALGAAVALAAFGAHTTWAAARAPTLAERISANGVDRAMLLVGDPPPGRTLRVNGASAYGFGAEYPAPPPRRCASRWNARDTTPAGSTHAAVRRPSARRSAVRTTERGAGY